MLNTHVSPHMCKTNLTLSIVIENLTYLLLGEAGVGLLKGGEAVFEFPEEGLTPWRTGPGIRDAGGWLLSQFFHRPTEKVFSRHSRISSLACFPEVRRTITQHH